MRSQIFIAGVAFVALGTASTLAQTIDQLIANHALLNAELDRCKQLGMASIDDARCKTANAAENKRFFGSGTHYSPSTPYMTPGSTVPNTGGQPPPASKPHDGQ